MASFVERLRMANMFPIRSNLGDARIPSIDPGYMPRMNIPNSGIRNISPEFRHESTLQPQLKFGGVVGEQSNPGGDILNRASQNAERLYDSYSQPINPQVSGPSNDEIHYQRYLDNALKEKTVDSTISQNERRIGNEERRLDQADTRINNTETVADRRLDVLEQGATNKAELAKQKLDEAETAKKNSRNAITSRAEAAMKELDSLLDENDQLTTRGQDAFGGVNNMISGLPWSTDSFDAGTVRDRLKNLLTLDLIGEMKSQSKTGATGFGALNLKELGVLEGGASRLTGKLSDKDAPNTLKEIRKRLKDILTESPDSNNPNPTGPKEGDIKVFPNGKKGRWDGTGWEAIK